MWGHRTSHNMAPDSRPSTTELSDEERAVAAAKAVRQVALTLATDR